MILSRVWSGIGTPVALIFGLSLRCSYATPHSVITSYRSPDSGGFALICWLVCIKNVQLAVGWQISVLCGNSWIHMEEKLPRVALLSAFVWVEADKAADIDSYWFTRNSLHKCASWIGQMQNYIVTSNDRDNQILPRYGERYDLSG